MVKRILVVLGLAAFFGVMTPLSVSANYVDPNTGGMLFQVLGFMFAFLSGLILFFAAHIRRAVGRLRRFWLEIAFGRLLRRNRLKPELQK